MTVQPDLRPATDDEIIDTLAFGLRFNRRRRVDRASPLIAQIPAEQLVRHLRQSEDDNLVTEMAGTGIHRAPCAEFAIPAVTYRS